MKWQITLKRTNEEIEITEKDYETISQYLNKAKLFKLENGMIIDSSQIRTIKPINEPEIISKEFRLSEPKRKEKLIKVPGGFQTLSERKRIKELFARLKKVGCFKEFATYEDWEEKKYGERFEDIQKNS